MMTCVKDYNYSYEEILYALKESLKNGRAVFDYTAIEFPTFNLTANINKKHSVKIKCICYADSVWRGYFREIILKEIRVSEVTINDIDNNCETLVVVNKNSINTCDFIKELSTYLEELKTNCDKLEKKGFRAWSIDKREMKKRKDANLSVFF